MVECADRWCTHAPSPRPRLIPKVSCRTLAMARGSSSCTTRSRRRGASPIVRGVVHAIGDRVVGVLRRRPDDHPLRPASVLAGPAVGEESAALEDHRPEGLHGSLAGLAPARTLMVRSRPPGVSAGWTSSASRPHGVVLEQMRERLRVRDVVHGDKLSTPTRRGRRGALRPIRPEPVDTDADAMRAHASRKSGAAIPIAYPQGQGDGRRDDALNPPLDLREVGGGGRGSALVD